MIRWLVRKVVKYVLEELREAPEFQGLVSGNSRTRAAIPVRAETIESQPESQESQKAIAELIASRTRDAKVSDLGSTEKVKGDRGAQRAVMDQLKNIGD
jgi:hypothetical protein